MTTVGLDAPMRQRAMARCQWLSEAAAIVGFRTYRMQDDGQHSSFPSLAAIAWHLLIASHRGHRDTHRDGLGGWPNGGEIGLARFVASSFYSTLIVERDDFGLVWRGVSICWMVPLSSTPLGLRLSIGGSEMLVACSWLAETPRTGRLRCIADGRK